MRVEGLRFEARTDELLAALFSGPVVEAYLRELSEVGGHAEAPMLAHLARMRRLASEGAQRGLAELMREDPAAADALCVDILAVATWHGWELPLSGPAEGTVDPAEVRGRGFFGHGGGEQGAELLRLGDGRWALVRSRLPSTGVRPRQDGAGPGP